MAIPYIISTFPNDTVERELVTDMVRKFSVVNEVFVVTSAQETAGQFVYRVPFGGRKKIRIETMNVFNTTNPNGPCLIGFHIGNFDMTLASGVPQPFTKLQYTDGNDIEVTELFWVVFLPNAADVISLEATWWEAL